MSRIVIVAYKPKAGKQAELTELLITHVPRLKALGLVTERTPIIAQSAAGDFIEVFEWASQEAIETAHNHPEVQQMWGEFAAVCEYQPVANIAETSNLFSEFTPVN
jgi:hypothetical protein